MLLSPTVQQEFAVAQRFSNQIISERLSVFCRGHGWCILYMKHILYAAHIFYIYVLNVFFKIAGFKIFAVCAEQLYKREREGDRNKESDPRCYSEQI